MSVPINRFNFTDLDPEETKEWLEALNGLIETEGAEKAQFLIEKLAERAREKGIEIPYSPVTPYINTIPPEKGAKMPSNSLIARNVAAYVRWNAMAMVVKANRKGTALGGHIASFASSGTLYETAMDYFLKGPHFKGGGDLVFFQGHSSPGMYGRAFVEGRLSEEELNHFREEAFTKGLSSYPHPRLMPDFWEFPTVSMGLGPLQAIYQARFMKYLEARGIMETKNRKVWAFLGDGETDEPESLGAINLASREKLNNLIFVINCNLQRLDGPVRGNGKIIQELEGSFRGSGWNVIKVIWGSEWDALLQKDKSGLLIKRMGEVVDGEYQTYKARGGAYMREHFFGKYPELLKLVEPLTDYEIFKLSRGGHDPRKLYAAYTQAVNETQRPTVILAKTVKGFGMGASGEAANTTHSQKKMDIESLKTFRDRFHVPLKDEELYDLPFIKPKEGSPEAQFIKETRDALGGSLPARQDSAPALKTPDLDIFSSLLKGSGESQISTTMVFVRLLSTLARQKNFGKQVVPIIPDEARTFGMEGMFRQLGIYSPYGQLYEPQDSDTVMWYREDKKGQILEEGINEAGSFASWLAAATAYANHGVNMIPFYIFYSMFGFQRIGDLAWLAGDIRARGFLLGATSGRTTLNGEGLQHQDGHGHIMAMTIPSCLSYDPSFGFELVLIIREGIRRMFEQKEDIFYYISLVNENTTQPALPQEEKIKEGVLKGGYLYKKSESSYDIRVNLMGSGAIFQQILLAKEELESQWNIACNLWSLPSINELAREGESCVTFNRHHPDYHNSPKEKIPYLTRLLKEFTEPVIIATDYIKAYPEQLRPYIPNDLTTLGTDGYGRSDSREALRAYFEVDSTSIILASLSRLETLGQIEKGSFKRACQKYGREV